MTIEGLGKKFEEARRARNLTLDEAARMTKIRPARLAEIEADDFSQFPSLAYAKGFLLIYGKFLDVDVTPYLDVFETSREVTVDGYSYLQDQPAPKARRVRTTRAPVVRRQRTSGDRRSPFPLLIGIGVIVVGFVLMRLIMNIQRIAPHQMVGVPQPTTAQSAPPQAPPAASVAPAPSRAASPPPAAVVEAPPKKSAPPVASAAPSFTPSTPPPTAVAEVAKKTAQPVATVAPSIALPDAVVPAFANTNAAAKASPPAFANASAAAKASVAPKEPEVRRAEPVRPEDLAKAGTAQTTQTAQKPAEAEGLNRIAIKPLKKTYIKVDVDNESLQPAFERWISPSDGTVELRGKKIAVRVLDRDAIQIRKNGKPVSGDDDDVTVE